VQHLSISPWAIVAIFFVFAYAWKLLSAPDDTKKKRPKYRMKNGEVDPYWKQWGH
jgi:hypothetical protein